MNTYKGKADGRPSFMDLQEQYREKCRIALDRHLAAIYGVPEPRRVSADCWDENGNYILERGA